MTTSVRLRMSRDQLLECARRQVGLTDFGRDSFKPGLDALIAAYTQEGELSRIGSVIVRRRILHALRTRLLVTHEIARDSRIRFTPIPRPLVIASLPRTGTTFLQRLLAQDPQARWLSTWEALMPARKPKDIRAGRDGRAASLWRLRVLQDAARVMWPYDREVHSFEFNGPEEELALQENSFMSNFVMLPSYRQWYLKSGRGLADFVYTELREQLQVVAHLRGFGQHWVLKSPSHMYNLRELSVHFPGAVIVQIHREPRDVGASMARMARVARSILSPARLSSIEAECLDWMASAIRACGEHRSDFAVGAIFDVDFQQLISEPLAVVRAIYHRFGYEYTPSFEERARRWLVRDCRRRSRGVAIQRLISPR